MSKRTAPGDRGLTFSVNRRLAPDAPAEPASQTFKLLRRDYGHAVCPLLDGA